MVLASHGDVYAPGGQYVFFFSFLSFFFLFCASSLLIRTLAGVSSTTQNTARFSITTISTPRLGLKRNRSSLVGTLLTSPVAGRWYRATGLAVRCNRALEQMEYLGGREREGVYILINDNLLINTK